MISRVHGGHGAVGETARADQTMLGLWFTLLTGRPAAALLAYRRLVDVTERRHADAELADRRRRAAFDDAGQHGGLVAW